MKTIVTLLVLAFSLQNCATLFTGTKQNLRFESEPSGAMVSVNGFDKGLTPCKIKVNKKQAPEIKVSKQGFQAKTFKPEQGFQAAALLNGFNIVGWAIDIVSGGSKKYTTNKYEITLEPEKTVNK